MVERTRGAKTFKKNTELAYKQKLDNARKWWKKYKFSNNQVN